MPKICLFDASGYLHRAFHAIPLLTTSRGEPVNAIYGFSRMVSKVLREDKPEYVAICFDTPAPTFRHTSYEAYKATRSEPIKELVAQLPVAETLAKAWGLPCVKMDGFEADDVIATLTKMGRDAGLQVLILSGDKDILQLVQDGVRVRDEMKKVELDEAAVRAKYGIGPEQLVDYLSLVGDKVDNVSGVPGVGEKTASKLLAEFGSLEGIYEKLNGAQPALKQKLKAHKETVFRNRFLVTLKSDVPVEVTIEKLRPAKPDAETLPELLKRLEFRGGLYGVEEVQAEAPLEFNKKRKVHTVLSERDLELCVEQLKAARHLSYDLETDSLDKLNCGLVGVSLSVRKDEAWYIPIGHRVLGGPAQLAWPRVSKALKPIFEDPNIMKVGQNLKFDDTVLLGLDIQVKGPAFDTMIAAYCIEPGRTSFGLKDLAADYLGEKMTRIDELLGKDKGASFADVPVEKAADYSGADSEVALRLWELFRPKLSEIGVKDLFENMEMPLVRVIQQMEMNGVAIDANYLRKVGEKFMGMQKALEQEIYKLAGEEFVLNSPKQMSRILFEKLKLPPVKKTKTGFSTDEEVLTKLAANHPICEKILACRELSKLNSTYVESLVNTVDAKTKRIHTSFNQTGAVTGRLSSTHPNLQNIPIRSENGREIRRAFVPAPGNILVSADYSQIDLRALAHISEDPVLIQTFKEGGDVHAATAAQIFHVSKGEVTPEMRRSAKAINFGIVYGQQAFALSQTLGVNLEVAREFINKYFERYAGVRAWIESTLNEARKSGFVTTLAGRRRSVADITSPNAFTRGFAERVAMNTPIQGTSADIIKMAMIRLASDLTKKGMKTLMIVQVHDELLFDVPKTELKEAIELIRTDMEGAYELRVPLIVDIKTGSNWTDMEKVA